MTPTRAQSREIHGVPYRVTTVTERKFFGFEPTSIEGTTVHVSDLEKTLVDCADHPEFCGGIRELATAMVAADEQGCSWRTVGEYLDRLDNGAATKRIVDLADQLEIDLPTREALVNGNTVNPLAIAPILIVGSLSVFDAYLLAHAHNAVARLTVTRDGRVIHCPNCGKELDSDLEFCHWCTTEIGDLEAAFPNNPDGGDER